MVQPDDGRGPRAALTVIYFLLPAGALSRWHRVRSDEVWQHCEGAPLELLQMPPDGWRLDRTLLGSLPAHEPMHVVPAQWWQAARTLGEYTLVSCTVAPGFEFNDFELLADQPTLAAEVGRVLPEVFTFV
jgi:predicted cupin superfamily sugar epimerase